jgi:hypothetical protein
MGKLVGLAAAAWALLLLGPVDASACDLSEWRAEQEASDCVEVRTTHAAHSLVNLCSVPVTLTAEDCSGVCPDDIELEAADERPLNLPASASDGDTFRLVSSGGDAMRFTYLANVGACEKDGGCHVGSWRSGAARQPGQRFGASALLLLAAVLWARRAKLVQ